MVNENTKRRIFSPRLVAQASVHLNTYWWLARQRVACLVEFLELDTLFLACLLRFYFVISEIPLLKLKNSKVYINFAEVEK